MTAKSRNNNSLIKMASNLYENNLYSALEKVRGTTKLRDFLRKSFYEVDKENNFILTSVSQNPVFCRRRDMKYYWGESEYCNRLLSATRNGDVFCDVGGYHGFYSLVSNSKKSIVFEADPSNADHIRQNLKLNPDRDIELLEKAVWSSNETLEFQAEGSGTSHVSDEGIQRQAITLDSFFEDREDPDVVKIDVEGAEGHVLEGADKVLRRSHPTIFMEIHLEGRTDSFGFSKEDLISILESHGYSIVFSENRDGEELVIAE